MSPEIPTWSACGAMLLYDLLHVPAKEVGNIIGDYLRAYRFEKLEQVSQKFQKIQKEKNLNNNELRVVNPKFGIPLLNAASLEDDDFLQETWARLLTNAVDPNFKSEIRVAFVDIITTLTAVDVKILKEIYSELNSKSKLNPTSVEVHINSKKIINSLDIDTTAYEVSLNNLERCQLISTPVNRWSNIDENNNIIKIFTALGISFVNACVCNNPQL